MAQWSDSVLIHADRINYHINDYNFDLSLTVYEICDAAFGDPSLGTTKGLSRVALQIHVIFWKSLFLADCLSLVYEKYEGNKGHAVQSC